jgi:4-amino-4-deoxy-L-arabinose transferase-like glycosyltransferase
MSLRYEPKKLRLHDAIALIACTAILFLALAIGYGREVGTFGVETDFYAHYAVEAKNLLAGRPYTYQHQPPGYSLFLAGVWLVTGDFFAAGKIISAFAAALLGWITYLLGKTLFDSRIALASTVLLLVSLVPYSFLAATDLPAATLIILTLYLLLRQQTPTGSTCFWVGTLAGVSYLVRANAIFLIPGIGVSLFLLLASLQPWQSRLMRIGLFLCGALVVIGSWLILNWQTNEDPLASTAYLQIAAYFYHPLKGRWGTDLREVAPQFGSLWEVFFYDPVRLLREYCESAFYKNIRLFRLEQGRSFFFAVAGFLLLLGDLCRRRVVFLAVCFSGYLLLGLVVFFIRYYLFLFPLFFLLVAYFFFSETFFGKSSGRILTFRVATSWLIIIFLAASLARDSYHATRHTLAAEPKHLLAIATFLQARSSPQDLIIARKPHLAYLAGLTNIFPLAKEATDFLAAAREHHARYIVYSDAEASSWQGLESLKDPSALPDHFKLIYRHEPTHTLVYEIDGSRS